MGRMLRQPSDTGQYVAASPFALMTLALGLPWMLVLSQVRLRDVILDAARGVVVIRPLGPLSRSRRNIPFSEIAELDIARAASPLLLRPFGRTVTGTRPVLWLKTGGSVPLVMHPIARKKSEKIFKMACKVLQAEHSQGR